jgi:hypothetical protein
VLVAGARSVLAWIDVATGLVAIEEKLLTFKDEF